MEWFKKHVDTVIILGGILGAMVWMNSKFNDIEIRLVKIETVLLVKGIMPPEIAITEKK